MNRIISDHKRTIVTSRTASNTKENTFHIKDKIKVNIKGDIKYSNKNSMTDNIKDSIKYSVNDTIKDLKYISLIDDKIGIYDTNNDIKDNNIESLYNLKTAK